MERMGHRHQVTLSEWRQFPISGLSCAAEAVGLERRLLHQHGVISAVVNPITERAYIDYDPASIGETDLVAFIESIGYHAR